VSLPPTYTAASARAAGLTRAGLRSSRFVRLAHDFVVCPDDAIDQRERLALLAGLLPGDAVYSHSTAAALLGTHVDMPVRAHVAMTPRRVLPQRAEFVVHTRRLAEDDVVVCHGLRTTSGPQTWLDLAERLPPHELVALGDALMRGGHLPAEALVRRLERATRVRGVVRARRCAPLLTPLSMSRPESLVRYWLVTSELPTPRPQVEVRDRWGRVVAHGDLGYEDWKVLLEYEGRQHAEPERFGRDIDRCSMMAADGWSVLRFAARHAESPTVVVDRTRRALVSRGWRPGAC
jgi:Protein of unknown function (DUF559)